MATGAVLRGISRGIKGLGNAATQHPAMIGAAVGIGTFGNWAAQSAFETAEVAVFGREDVDQAILGRNLDWKDVWNPLPSFLHAPPAYDLWRYRDSPVVLETAFGRPNGPSFEAPTKQDYYAAMRNVDTRSFASGYSDYPYRGSSYSYKPMVNRTPMAGGNQMSAQGSMLFGMHNLRR